MSDEAIINVRLRALQRSVDDGFARVDERLKGVETDVKALREAGLPRRVSLLERWRDRLSAKMWALLTGVILALLGALIGVVI